MNEGMVQVGWRDECPKCGKDAFFFFDKCLCDCITSQKCPKNDDLARLVTEFIKSPKFLALVDKQYEKWNNVEIDKRFNDDDTMEKL